MKTKLKVSPMFWFGNKGGSCFWKTLFIRLTVLYSKKYFHCLKAIHFN